jgi:hypothetical protein
MKSLARAFTDVSIATLGGWVTCPKTDPDLKFRSIIALLDRGWGKPEQDNKHEVKGAVEVIIRDIAAEKAKKK